MPVNREDTKKIYIMAKNNKNIRSKVIQSLVEDKNKLMNDLKENSKDALKSMLGEAVKESIRSIISEGSEYSVEDVEKDTEVMPDANISECGDACKKYVNEDGVIDLSKETDNDKAVDILGRYADGDDEITILKKDDNTISIDGDGISAEVNVDDINAAAEGDTIPLNGGESDNEEEGDSDDENDDVTIDIDSETGEEDSETQSEEDSEEDDDGVVDASEEDEDDFYSKLNEMANSIINGYECMDRIPNKETSKFGRNWDKGVPEDTMKPFPGKKGDNSPYDIHVNEDADECGDSCSSNIYEVETECNDECVYEAEIESDELANAPVADDGQVDEVSVHASARPFKNASVDNAGIYGRNTMKNKIGAQKRDGEVNESVNKRISEIVKENKELKAIATEIKNRLDEAVTVNSAYANIIRLLSENSTSREEKIDIIKRFSKVNDINESKRLYSVISEELSKSRRYMSTQSPMNRRQVFESRGNNPYAQEDENMVKSNEFAAMKSLMDRVMAIK